MFFKFFTSNKYEWFFELVLYLVLFTFIITTNSCQTTKTEHVPKEALAYKTDYEIVNVVMKNGLVINLRDKNATYLKEYGNQKNVIVYNAFEPIPYVQDTAKIAYHQNVIDLANALSITVERTEVDVALTILATLGIIAALALLAIVIIAATKESCPFIYSFDGEKYVFDAEPYGGAITEGLRKTDYSRLENLKPVNEKYKLLMRNEADETQHTDEMKLLVIDHSLNSEVVPDLTGNMTLFDRICSPISVIDENGKGISAFFKDKDGVKWQTELPKDNAFMGKDLKHSLIFKFPKPRNAKSVKFLFNGGTALWGGYMIKEMLQLRGNKVDDWYQNINNGGIELLKLYQFMDREELYSLKVKVLENSNWVQRGYLAAGGPFIYEDRIVDLNIENVNDDTLSIQVNPPYGFWEIDQVGIIYDELQQSETKELNISSASDQDGKDISGLLSSRDGKYYDMPDTSCKATIYFDVPIQKENTKRSLFLKTTGYYDIHLKKDKPEQTELIAQILTTPGLILKYAMEQYVNKIKSLESSDNLQFFEK